jgi:hypothetical protein
MAPRENGNEIMTTTLKPLYTSSLNLSYCFKEFAWVSFGYIIVANIVIVISIITLFNSDA